MVRHLRIIGMAMLALALSSCDAFQRLLPNEIPVADAGADRTVTVNTLVYVDGEGSSDGDGDDLTYTWLFWDAPSGTNTLLYNYKSRRAYFTPDRIGAYVFLLQVNDGIDDSAPDKLVITATF